VDGALATVPLAARGPRSPRALEAKVVRLNLRHTWTTTMSASQYRDTLQLRYIRDGVPAVGEAAPIVRSPARTASSAKAAVLSVPSCLTSADPWQFSKVMAQVFSRIDGQFAAKPPSTLPCWTGSVRSSAGRCTATSAWTRAMRP